jgi:phage tail-like protein
VLIVEIPDIPGPLPLVGNPPLKFRFGVFFFAAGVVPNPVDILFEKVSGLQATVDNSYVVNEGGQNLYSHRLPTRVKYDNLVLERGVVVGSPLSIEFNVAMSMFKFVPSNVIVTLLDNTKIPIAAWLFLNAYPVNWRFSDLDAKDNNVAIEHMELAYQRMQVIAV